MALGRRSPKYLFQGNICAQLQAKAEIVCTSRRIVCLVRPGTEASAVRIVEDDEEDFLGLREESGGYNINIENIIGVSLDGHHVRLQTSRATYTG